MLFVTNYGNFMQKLKPIYFYIICFIIAGCSVSVDLPSPQKEATTSSPEDKQKIDFAVQFHDNGKYETALKIYDEVLSKNPDNTTAIYEKAFTYYKIQKYDIAIELCKKGLEYKGNLLSQFYTIMANAFDNSGKVKQAIYVYEKGISLFPDDYMLHYNAAITYSKQSNFTKTEEHLIQALKINPEHASSLFALGQLYISQNETVKALFPLLRFMIVENNTDRAKTAYDFIEKILGLGVYETSPNHINISLNLHDKSPYSTLDMLLKLHRATRYTEENKNKPEMELRVKDIETIFHYIAEPKTTIPDDFCGKNLYPYFIELDKKGYTESFVYLITSCFGAKPIKNWLQTNEVKVNEMLDWNKNYKW